MNHFYEQWIFVHLKPEKTTRDKNEHIPEDFSEPKQQISFSQNVKTVTTFQMKMYSEEQLAELETLESIFGDDYQFNEEEGVVSIKVVPSVGGADVNYVAVRLSVSLEEDYPSFPLRQISLSVLEGTIPDDLLDYFRFMMVEKAREWEGELVIWKLVDYLSDELKIVNEDASFGSFSSFPFEVILNIFKRLDEEDLCRLSMVSKAIQQYSDSDLLWEPFVKRKSEIKEGWKKEYLRQHQLQTPKWRFIASIADRKGTGDEWDNGAYSWQQKFRDEFSHLQFKIDKKRIMFQGNVIGHIKFYSIKEVEEEFGKEVWFNGKEKYQTNCNYLGEIIGYVKWDMFDMKTELIAAISSICRGACCNIEEREKEWTWCVMRKRLLLWQVVNEPHIRRTGIMVIPMECKTRNRYLNEMIESINWKLKSKSVGNIVPYVDFISDRRLYPMRLDGIIHASKMQIKFDLWIYNWDALDNALLPNEPRTCSMIYSMNRIDYEAYYAERPATNVLHDSSSQIRSLEAERTYFC